MIRIDDPANLGPTLADIRTMHGIRRRDLARTLATTTGLKPMSLDVKLWRWETGDTTPSLPSLAAWLDALGYDLALIPRQQSDEDAPRAPLSEPQGREARQGVPECTPGHSEAAETRSEPICDCGHDGLDAMWHFRPCPVAERRAAEAVAELHSLRQQPHAWTPNCGEACKHDTDDYPPLQETYPGSGIYE